MRQVFAALAVMLIAASPALSKDMPDGKKLYDKYCAECHGPVAGSDIRGATLDEVRYAMTGRMCGETGGASLDDAQLESITRTLAGKAR